MTPKSDLKLDERSPSQKVLDNLKEELNVVKQTQSDMFIGPRQILSYHQPTKWSDEPIDGQIIKPNNSKPVLQNNSGKKKN